jgi:tRNA A-37 threonylcarbamoyl transferase component Bud32
MNHSDESLHVEKVDTSAANPNASANILCRSNAVVVTYRLAWGASLRRLVPIPISGKLYIAAFVVVAYFGSAIFVMLPPLNSAAGATLGWIYSVAGWLLCCLATLFFPNDGLYLDRLWCLIPTRNPLGSSKVLWSKVQEVTIVDLNQSETNSQFALRLLEISGAQHHIILHLLTRESLAQLVNFMRDNAPHIKGLAQLSEADRFFNYETGSAGKLSYTQLWESSCTAQFGLTSFTPLLPDSKIQQSFTVIRQIAAGGFSAIYLIRDQDGAEFVLKESVLPPALDEVSKAKATEHFQREASILAKLNHARIARVYDHFVENGRNYLRLEYVRGTNMRSFIQQNGLQSEDCAVKWMSQLSEILAYLHELSPPVVHRDLTPDNIVVREDGSLMLIDFGAANEFIGSATGTLIGKHAYMAPEQIRGNAEPSSDVYALGACGYFMLAGRDPEPIRMCSLTRDGVSVSSWMNGAIEKCTQLERADRFNSARDVFDHLRALAC